MLQRRVLLVLTSFVFLVAARHRAVQHPAGWPLTEPPADVFTFSNPAAVAVRHVALDLTVDFASRTLRGNARLDIENLTGTNTLVLDTDDLTVSSVKVDGTTTSAWSWGTSTTHGRPLHITITPTTQSVTVDYVTSPGAEGLNWNTAAQSFGRQQPYLYSLNEPIEARSWIPIQDTPSHRVTYEATIRVPSNLLALMSASDNPTERNDTGVYTFHMPYKIPAYLIAIAVGRLEFHAFDERTGVYAEPELMPAAEWDLRYLPDMVDAAERVAGTFPFERHDVLLMPPTFVAGGMEHPMLNFVEPTRVATGNFLPQTNPSTLIAHELAHSWAGDSATLGSWDDVWINEGITSYLTWRIMEELMGPERAEVGWHLDRASYSASAGQSTSPSTILHRATPQPFAGFNSTGYTKGALFMKTLEDTIGRATFDVFLRRYFQIFAYRWVDHLQFLALLDEIALDARPDVKEQLRLSQWLYEPGLPSNVTAPTSSAVMNRVFERVARYDTGTPIAQLDPASWTEVEIELFLQGLDLSANLAEIDAALGLSARNLPPLPWLGLSIATNYEPGMAGVERTLMAGGPNGVIVSLYNALMAQGLGDRARQIFAIARDRYHEAVEQTVAARLGVNNAKAALRNAA
ncbi:MAG TPA: M1 family aminopeptidase [Thermoanaerobaculia bacterium]|nr:M1 family aminopeptidase [Thermoanaerobaculia bacterium]